MSGFEETARDTPDDVWARLPERPRMVLTLSVNGMSTKEVGRSLGISPRTAEQHKYRAMLMLGLRDKAALIDFARRRGLLGAPSALMADASAEPAVGAAPPEPDALPPHALLAPETRSGPRRTPGLALPAIGARAVATGSVMPACLVGTSAAIQDLHEQMARFAACDAPVLITCEYGVGKRMVAREIRNRSARAASPFVTVSCGTCGGPVADSEASEAGRCTRHPRCRPIRAAHGGTLFVEEVGDMSAPLQGELLRLLQDSDSGPAGGAAQRRPDVRVIAATGLRPHDALAPGRVSEALYYRLDVLRLDIPPLRERPGDLPLLADHILRRLAAELGRDVRAFAPAALELILAYPWPGNVQELINAIYRAVVLSSTRVVQPADLRLRMPQRAALPADPAAHPAPGTGAERDTLMKTLRANDFNISRTARELGRSRMTLYRMLMREGLATRHDFVVRDAAARRPNTAIRKQ